MSELFNISEDTSNTVHAHLSQASLLYLVNTCLYYQWNVVSLTPKINDIGGGGISKQGGHTTKGTINNECKVMAIQGIRKRLLETQRERGTYYNSQHLHVATLVTTTVLISTFVYTVDV
ncbi:MAG: hypothetical protein MJE68_18765 [Proteobacteria bacterium]|nr:hypothetical protein [Pseudomonadota bacterium]